MDNTNIHNPLVSIIVVTYNSAKFVIETLESAKAQLYNNIELIVTDDCSKDETVKLCSKWIAQNKNYFVDAKIITSEVNTGIASNCNRGLRASKGEWLKYIAGDDLLLDNCIADNLDFVNQYPNAKFITSKTENIGDNGNPYYCGPDRYKALRKFYFGLSAKMQLKTYARLPVFLNSPAFFMNRELIVSVNGFDEEFKIYEDICIIFRINDVGERVYFFNSDTVKYRVHENAISRNKNSAVHERRNKEQILIFKKYRKKHLHIYNIVDLSVFYETWLLYEYKGFFGIKMISILQKFSVFFWYLKLISLKYKK
jgi:alpha-1,3-rhamnosyltransferase